jgi:hypothetical protein
MLEPLARVSYIYEREYVSARSPQQVEEAERKVAKLWADNVWRIGLVGRAPNPLIIGNRVANVPEVLEAPPACLGLRGGVFSYQLVVPPEATAGATAHAK